MLSVFYTIFLIVAYNLTRRLQETTLFFLMLILFVSALLVNFKLFEKIVYFIRQDIKRYNIERLDLMKRLILALLWIVAVFAVRKAALGFLEFLMMEHFFFLSCLVSSFFLRVLLQQAHLCRLSPSLIQPFLQFISLKKPETFLLF